MYTPRQLPLSSPSTPFIAPFWADVDTSNNGRIYYRAVTTGRFHTAALYVGIGSRKFLFPFSSYGVVWERELLRGNGIRSRVTVFPFFYPTAPFPLKSS